MSKVLVVDQKKCTNCRMCELSCSQKKTGEFSPLKSRIRVNAFPKDAAYILQNTGERLSEGCRIHPVGLLSVR